MQRVFEALSSSVRRQILAYLAHAELNAGEIASRFAMSKPSISQHLSVLESAGLVVAEKRGQFVYYRQVQDGDRYCAELSFGVGRVRGRYNAGLQLSNVVTLQALDLVGRSSGLLGSGSAVVHVELTQIGDVCTGIAWTYNGVVTGPVAMAGSVVLQASSRVFVERFFAAFAHHVVRLAKIPRPVTTLALSR